MCKSGKDHVRTYNSGAARLTQCLECRTLGIQIGSAYFAVKPHEIEGLAKWFFEVQRTKARRVSRKETLFLQIESSRIMLALTVRELEDLLEILREAFHWSKADIAFQPVSEPTMLSEMVH